MGTSQLQFSFIQEALVIAMALVRVSCVSPAAISAPIGMH